MLFHSVEFLLVFLPVLVASTGLVRVLFGRSAALTWLLLSSLVFYAVWEPAHLLILLGAIGFNYYVGSRLTHLDAGPARVAALALGVGANLGLIGYYKYAEFIRLIVRGEWSAVVEGGGAALPLGISFFTFQQIAYLVGCFATRENESSGRDYALFIGFFPQLVAGPIVRHDELLPQFKAPGVLRVTKERFSVFLSLAACGLFKKLVLADSLSPHYETIRFAMEDGRTLTLIEAWLGMLCAAFYIYFDYSAYADFAAGTAFLFGIAMPVNFLSPYKALTVGEFWRRWNVTLMRFLRDHVYIPLGGNRRGVARKYVNVFVLMVLCGIWHGAGMNFIYWGVLVSIILCAESACGGALSAASRNLLWGWIHRFLARTYVAIAYVVPLVFFMTPELDLSLDLLSSMLGQNGVAVPGHWIPVEFHPWLDSVGIDAVRLRSYGGFPQLGLLIVAGIVIYTLPSTPEIFRRTGAFLAHPLLQPLRYEALNWRPSHAWGLGIGALLAAAVFVRSPATPYFYFQF